MNAPHVARTKVYEEPTRQMRALSSIEELDFATAMPMAVTVESATDHALLQGTLAGDEDAFAELVGRYRNQITSYIYRMTNDYDGAVDLAQETFLRVYRAAARYQTTHAFSTYIYRIATNLAISELRKRKRRRMVSLTGLMYSYDGENAQDFNPPDENPLQDVSLVDAERRRVVKKASKIFSRFASEIGSPSLLTVNLTEASSSTASSRTVFALWRMALSVRCDNTINAFSPDMPIERSRHPVASIARVGNRLFNPPTTCANSIAFTC